MLAYTQEGNDDAKRFYTEKGGFIEVELYVPSLRKVCRVAEHMQIQETRLLQQPGSFRRLGARKVAGLSNEEWQHPRSRGVATGHDMNSMHLQRFQPVKNSRVRLAPFTRDLAHPAPLCPSSLDPSLFLTFNRI